MRSRGWCLRKQLGSYLAPFPPWEDPGRSLQARRRVLTKLHHALILDFEQADEGGNEFFVLDKPPKLWDFVIAAPAKTADIFPKCFSDYFKLLLF